MDGCKKTLEVEAETKALRWAVMMMVRLNYTNVVSETDCKSLLPALQDKNSNPSILAYTQDIHNLLTKIGTHQVIFKCRQSNGVADMTAKEAISLNHEGPVLYSNIPSWIKFLVEVDKLAG